MKIRQWEIAKCRPPGFERDHWFVIVSGQERCDEPRHLLVNVGWPVSACAATPGNQKSV
jgi:hypothetical protein